MRKKIILICIIIAIIIGVYFLYKYIKNNFVEVVKDEYTEYTPEQEISDEQLRQTKVNLYFKNKETGEIESEFQSIDAKLLVDDPYTQLINLLIQGPKSEGLIKLIPTETMVNKVTREKNILVIDLSEHFLNFENEENKEKSIKSIVNTVTQLTEIDKVRFLINGENNQNLEGEY